MHETFPRFAITNPLAPPHLSIDPVERALLDAWLGRLSAQDIVRWAAEVFGSGLVMTSAFGLNGVALIHMVQAIDPDVPVVFVDTGYLFEETVKTKQKIEAAFRVRILTYRPSLGQEAQTGQNAWPDLMTHRPDGCCALRKIEPMQRAMAELQPLAVLNARARFQCRTRRSLPIVEWDQMPLRINPLVDWSLDRIRAYVTKNQVPYNPLHDVGYPSIGCWPCTQPVQAGDDFRSGRWTGTAKIECGLWTRKPTSRDRQPLGQITTLEVAAD